MRQLARVGFAVLLACSPDDADTDADSDTDTDGELFEAPEFLEPPGDELTFLVSRTEDLDFAVRGVRSGLTQVLVDGLNVGGASDPKGLARLSTERLQVSLNGAMIQGRHSLQLQSIGSEGLLDSEVVTLIAAPLLDVALSATRSEDVAFEADAIDAHGHGSRGILFGLDLSNDEVTATLAPARDEGWALDDQIEVALPEFDRSEDARFSFSAALHLVEDSERVRLAWRSGAEGRTLLGADMLWPPATTVVQVVVDPTVFDGFEYGRLGRPLVLGNTLVVEALLTNDIEQLAPGDRTLLTSAIDSVSHRFGAARPSAVGLGHDIEHIEPVRDLLTDFEGGTPGFSARTAGLRAVVYDIDAASGAVSERPGGPNDRFAALGDAHTPPHTILGALQSRHVFAELETDARVFLRQFDDRPQGDSSDARPVANQLEDIGETTAPITSTVIAGLPVFLLPQGTEAPVVALVSAGPRAFVRVLDELACDEVAAPITAASDAGTVAVACRRGRDVYMGTIAADAQS